MSWLTHFWAAVAAPGWWAQFLQTIIAAGLAFGAAAVVLRRQLRHDRQLARDQRLQDIEQAAADRRAGRAEQIGRSILAALRVLSDLTAVEYVATVRRYSGDSWYDTMPGVRDLFQIEDELRLVANPEVFYPFQSLWSIRADVWRLAHQVLAELDKSEAFGDTSDERFSLPFTVAVDNALYPSTDNLARFATDLVRWNGHGDWPAPSTYDEAGNLVGRRKTAEQEVWAYEVRAEIYKQLLDHVGKD